MSLLVRSPGPLTTLQDAGRTGLAAQGYPECGACDKAAMRLANLLCGNAADPDAAVLECTLAGPTLFAEADTVLAVCGAPAPLSVDDRPVSFNAPLLLRRGQTLHVGAAASGLRIYIAVYGGFDVPQVLGSRSTDLKCRIGGLEGRPIRAQDTLPVGRTRLSAVRAHARLIHAAAKLPSDPWLLRPLTPLGFMGGLRMPLLRVVPGPQQEAFTDGGYADFFHGPYAVTADSNRMACKLSGPAVASVSGVDILSDGILEGSIQISANGQPIVMLADHQTTGGYAKAGTVISCDLPALAQVRPGEMVCFRRVDVRQGIVLCRSEADRLKALFAPLRCC